MTIAINFCFAQEASVKFQRGFYCSMRKSCGKVPTIFANLFQNRDSRITGPGVHHARSLQCRSHPEAISGHQIAPSQPLVVLIVEMKTFFGCMAFDEGSPVVLNGFRINRLQREPLPDLGASMLEAISDRKEDTDFQFCVVLDDDVSSGIVLADTNPLMPDIAAIEQGPVVQHHALGWQYIVDHCGHPAWAEGSKQANASEKLSSFHSILPPIDSPDYFGTRHLAYPA